MAEPGRRAKRTTNGRATRKRAVGKRPSRAPRAVLLLSAYPTVAAARRAARSLVASRLLACATVTPGGHAYYRWEGALRSERTALLWGKTTAAKGAAALRAAREGHPDRVPELLLLPVAGGHAPYLAWLAAETRGRR